MCLTSSAGELASTSSGRKNASSSNCASARSASFLRASNSWRNAVMVSSSCEGVMLWTSASTPDGHGLEARDERSGDRAIDRLSRARGPSDVHLESRRGAGLDGGEVGTGGKEQRGD